MDRKFFEVSEDQDFEDLKKPQPSKIQRYRGPWSLGAEDQKETIFISRLT